MEPIRFACRHCKTKLKIGAKLKGRFIPCPKCGQNTPVPDSEDEVGTFGLSSGGPIEQEAPAARSQRVDTPAMDDEDSPFLSDPDGGVLRFSCRHCKAKLRVGVDKAGRFIPCPKCGQNTPTPDADEVDDGATYDMSASQSAKSAPARLKPSGPHDENWCVDHYAVLSSAHRSILEKARALAQRRSWTAALAELQGLFRSLGGKATAETRMVCKPLSYCLVQWSIDELANLLANGQGLSKPMRELLRTAADKRKWGGAFSIRECPLCERQDPQKRGCTKLKTAVGPAYLCCAAPTRADLNLVKQLDVVSKRLMLARTLDDKNESAIAARNNLPSWYGLLTTDSETGWVKKLAGEAAAQSDGGSFLGAVLGEVINNIGN